MTNENEEVELPKSLCHQINEHTNGGYLLFFFDANGCPRQVANFDSVGHGMGMQKHICTWVDAINAYSIDFLVEQIKKASGESEE